MPQKLTTAWGINGSIPRLVIQQQFPTYERVLTHPVFVGIFSKLICDGELFQTGEEQTMEAHLTVGEYSFHHAEFYRSVISNGVEWGLDERGSDSIGDKVVDKEFILNIFNTLSYIVYRNNGERNIEKILPRLKSLLGVSEDSEMDLIAKKITEEFGILYATDGVNLEWVHKTLYEAGHASYCQQYNPEDSDSVVDDAMTFIMYDYLEHMKLENPNFKDTLKELIVNSEHQAIRKRCL